MIRPVRLKDFIDAIEANFFWHNSVICHNFINKFVMEMQISVIR